MFDKRCMDLVQANINMSVPWYLMASYAYYEEDNPILTDDTYDKLARMMDKFWNDIEHRHKTHITKDSLTAGTFLGKYPSIIPGALENLRGLDETKHD